jgi:hypothetical protein
MGAMSPTVSIDTVVSFLSRNPDALDTCKLFPLPTYIEFVAEVSSDHEIKAAEIYTKITGSTINEAILASRIAKVLLTKS